MGKYALVLLIGLIQAGCAKNDGGGSGSSGPQKPTPAQAVQICPSGAQPAQCQSFLMMLRGKNGQPPNANDLTAVAASIGSIVSQLKTQNYVMIQLYPEGGFQSCLDPVVNGGYDAAAYALSTFRVGSATSWDVVMVKSCTGGR